LPRAPTIRNGRHRSAAQAQRLGAILHQPFSGTAADWLERWLPPQSK